MNWFAKYRTLTKYGILLNLPGDTGQRYRLKRASVLLDIQFDEAIHLSNGKTCIDLGANVGKYTRMMALGTTKVIAFEPDPWTYSVLQANIADLDNVKIENAAAGTSDRSVLLYRHARFEDNPAWHPASTSVVLYDRSLLSEDRAIEVRQIDFINYLQELDEDIGVLKIDIEGAEVDLLEALFDRPDILERIDYIFSETHEGAIPDHEPRVRALRTRAQRMEGPRVNVDWN